MRYITPTLILASATLAAPVMAQSVGSGGTVDYVNGQLTYTTFNGNDLVHLNGAIDYSIGELSFTLSGHHYARSGSNNISSLTGKVAYNFTPEFAAFGHVTHVDLGSSETAYGIGVDYQTDKFGVGAQYITVDGDDIVAVSAFYKPSDTFTALGSIAFADGITFHGLGVDYSLDRFGVTASTNWSDSLSSGITTIGLRYDISQRIGVFGNVLTFNSDFLSDGIVSIGGEYGISDSVSVQAFYGKQFGPGSSDDIFGVGLTFEMGKDRARVLDRVDMYNMRALGPMQHATGTPVFTQIYGSFLVGS